MYPLGHLPLFAQTQMDSAPQKDGISNSMKERLMREASTGLDSDQKQPNVILYISLAIALLVVLGGAGIFY
jgi:preprotein translocase subunit Sec61beta